MLVPDGLPDGAAAHVSAPDAAAAPVPRLFELHGDGPPITARAFVGGLRLDVPVGDRPRVVAAMIMSADGRAQLTDRSVGLGNAADRDVLRELRTGADAVLVGSRTLHAERYATLLDPEQRTFREQQGMAPHPVVVVVSRDLSLPADEIPLFDEPGVPVVVATEAPHGDLGPRDADVELMRFPPGGLRFGALLTQLRAGHAVRGVTCEGGPGLLRELLAQACVDELLLTVAPKLVGGDALTVLTGERLGPRGLDLDLAGVLRAEDHVFLRYARASS